MLDRFDNGDIISKGEGGARPRSATDNPVTPAPKSAPTDEVTAEPSVHAEEVQAEKIVRDTKPSPAREQEIREKYRINSDAAKARGL